MVHKNNSKSPCFSPSPIFTKQGHKLNFCPTDFQPNCFSSRIFDSQLKRANDIILENLGCLLCPIKISSSNSSWKKTFGTITFFCSTKFLENSLHYLWSLGHNMVNKNYFGPFPNSVIKLTQNPLVWAQKFLLYPF